jgi:hypothetical protein
MSFHTFEVIKSSLRLTVFSFMAFSNTSPISSSFPYMAAQSNSLYPQRIAPATASETCFGVNLSEPNVPMPMHGIFSPEGNVILGIEF